MAEFQEVMRQYDRMCSHYEECAGCPFHRNVIWCIKKIGGKRYVNENARPAEEIIMAWAAEHPEPQYPTWIEFFLTLGLSERDGDGYRLRVEELNKPMDPGIAQELGVNPKEG